MSNDEDSRPPKLSITGRRFNLVLDPSFMDNQMVEMREHYGFKNNTLLSRFALQELYRSKDKPSLDLTSIGLKGFVGDYRNHDFSEYLMEAEKVLIYSYDFPSFWYGHDHAECLARRFNAKRKTHIVFTPPETPTERALMEETVEVARTQGANPLAKNAAIYIRNNTAYIPQFLLMTEDVAIATPTYSDELYLALIWNSVARTSPTVYAELQGLLYDKSSCEYLLGSPPADDEWEWLGYDDTVVSDPNSG